MGIMRIIIWLFLFYIIYKGIKFIAAYISGSLQSSAPREKVARDNSNIKKEDIIDADFEEIDPNKEENSNK